MTKWAVDKARIDEEGVQFYPENVKKIVTWGK